MAGEKTIIKTAFPGLQAAAGVKPDEMEVIGGDAAPAIVNNSPDAAPVIPTPVAGAATPDAPIIETPAKEKLNLEDFSEEEINQFLEKKSNGKIKSLDDLNPPAQKTKEQIEADALKRKQDALSWALDTGKLQKDAYDSAVILKSQPDRDLALAAFTESVKLEDDKITDQDAEEMFKDLYHEGADTDSFLFKRGQREISKLAESVRKEKVSVLDEIEPDFDQYMQSQDQYKGFKKQVKKIYDEMPKTIEFDIPHMNLDKSEGSFKVSAEVDKKTLDAIAQSISSERSFVIRNLDGDNKIDDKALAKEFNDHLKAKLFDTIVPQMLKEHGENVEQKLLAQLGNKRNQTSDLNPGIQTTIAPASPKQNVYPGLREAMQRN